MSEVYVLMKEYAEPFEQGYHDTDRVELVDVYESLELAVQLSGGRGWSYHDQESFGCLAFSEAEYTKDDPRYVIYKRTVKSE